MNLARFDKKFLYLFLFDRAFSFLFQAHLLLFNSFFFFYGK